MKHRWPLITWVLVILLAGCSSAAPERATIPASVPATSSASAEPDTPSPSPSQVPTRAPNSPSPSVAPPSAPAGVTAKSAGGEKPGTMITVRITWAGATATDTYRIYVYRTGEVPNPECVFNAEQVGGLLASLAETQPGATSAKVKLDAAETGAGTRCLYIVAVNAAGESSPVLAWRSSD